MVLTLPETGRSKADGNYLSPVLSQQVVGLQHRRGPQQRSGLSLV